MEQIRTEDLVTCDPSDGPALERLLKDGRPPARYASDLERLVTDLALKTREIRTLEGDATP